MNAPSARAGQRYLGAMRAAINCALANREILGHFARRIFGHFFPGHDLQLLFDVSHNTCKVEPHVVRDIAWKAQVRLCAQYRRLSATGKKLPVVVAAIAREIAGSLRLEEP